MTTPFFYIFTSGYNCQQYVDACLKSVDDQTYKNFKHIVVNDCSTDKTKEACLAKSSPQRTYVQNPTNLKWLKSAELYLKPNDQDIVITLDLDDWLYDKNVLSYLAELYSKNNCWLTYGLYTRLSKFGVATSHCRPFSPQTLANRSFRRERFITSHLRTFKGFLWNNIRKADLLGPDGQYGTMAWDIAMMFPMLEMCKPGKIICADRILYVYNDNNPLNDHKVDRGLQARLDEWYRKKPGYNILTQYA